MLVRLTEEWNMKCGPSIKCLGSKPWPHGSRLPSGANYHPLPLANEVRYFASIPRPRGRQDAHASPFWKRLPRYEPAGTGPTPPCGREPRPSSAAREEAPVLRKKEPPGVVTVRRGHTCSTSENAPTCSILTTHSQIIKVTKTKKTHNS